MSEQTGPEARQRSPKKGGGLVPALCSILGTLILVAAILTVLPVTVPRFMGYEIYNVLSGSMEPAIPVGSIVYVKETDPAEIAENDVIAFNSMGTVVTHRVTRNDVVEGEFVTKGDANEAEDLWTVDYDDLIGKVSFHAPVLGSLMEMYTTGIGKIYLLLVAGCGAMLNLLGGKLRERNADEDEEE